MTSLISDRRSDADLLAGSPEAFARLYRRHEEALLRYFLRRTRSAEVAADLTAETFARVLAHRADYQPGRGDVIGWIFGIARNVLLRSFEQGRVEDATRLRLQMQPVVLDDADLARVDALGAEQPVLEALDALPVRQKDAVVERVLEEHSYAEMAMSLRCSESVVRQRVSRGLQTIRIQLQKGR